MEKVNQEKAQTELHAWLDSKRVSAKKRETNASVIDTLVDAIVSGSLSFNDDSKVLTQYLQFPIGEKEELKSLQFKNRITQGDISARLKNVKSDDAFAVMAAYVAAITGQTAALLDKMDTSDYSIAQSVAVFFI